MYTDSLLSENFPGIPETNGRCQNLLRHVFSLLPPKRQLHLNAVTRLAHALMNLRRRYEPSYPIYGDEEDVQNMMTRLLIAYNLHDIGDVPVDIPEELIYTSETSTRRQPGCCQSESSAVGFGRDSRPVG